MTASCFTANEVHTSFGLGVIDSPSGAIPARHVCARIKDGRYEITNGLQQF